MNHLHIYFLAGVQTKDSAFITLSQRIKQLLEQKEIDATIELLYPYGDYSRKLWKQVLDICVDFNFIGKNGGIGGRRVKGKLVDSLQNGATKFLLIGHSGGGVAAYRLARFLHYHCGVALEQLRVVQVGSPKIRVAPLFQPVITYVQAADEQGKPKDPITKIGHWGGISLKQKPLGWNRQKYAPSLIHTVPLIGGHADYFRVNAPFIDVRQQSNLDYTFHAIENGLYEWI